MFEFRVSALYKPVIYKECECNEGERDSNDGSKDFRCVAVVGTLKLRAWVEMLRNEDKSETILGMEGIAIQ